VCECSFDLDSGYLLILRLQGDYSPDPTASPHEALSDHPDEEYLRIDTASLSALAVVDPGILQIGELEMLSW